jgi:hypothetical protein
MEQNREVIQERIHDIVGAPGIPNVKKVEKIMTFFYPQEEVKEKGWEIVKVTSNNSNWVWVKENGKWVDNIKLGSPTDEEISKSIENGNVSIHSIRTATGTFSVGDKVVWDWADANGEEFYPIESFRLPTELEKFAGVGSMYIQSKGWNDIDLMGITKMNLRHYTEPVQEKVEDWEMKVCGKYTKDQWETLKTKLLIVMGDYDDFLQTIPEKKKFLLLCEDAVAITEKDDMVYGVYPFDLWDEMDTTAANVGDATKSMAKWFSGPENRQEWVEYHKPCLSQKEVIEEVLAKMERRRGLEYAHDYIETAKCALDSYVIEKLAKQKLQNG